MNKYPTLVCILVLILAITVNTQYCKTSGKKILDTNGKELFIKGISIGNWLNPEGYMLGLDKINSYRTIDIALSELLSQKGAIDFWTSFRSTYITA
jgi:endoglucanase